MICLWATVYQIAHMLKLRVVILMPSMQGIEVKAGYPPEDELDRGRSRRRALDLGTWSCGGAGRGHAARCQAPVSAAKTGGGPIGVLGIDREEPGPLLTPEGRRLLDALAGQAAIAIERITLAADIASARMTAETERLRSALLTSISHDLRTPLASIIGALTSSAEFRRQL